jgi:hypothetical protein
LAVASATALQKLVGLSMPHWHMTSEISDIYAPGLRRHRDRAAAIFFGREVPMNHCGAREAVRTCSTQALYRSGYSQEEQHEDRDEYSDDFLSM